MSRVSQPSYRVMAVLLAAITALGPFSIDTYLPSFHDIAESLGASPLEVQQTLTTYLLPFSVMMLWHGALSDALGRRRFLLVGLALYVLAALACLLATRIEHLWLARAAMGVSAGVGMVVGRAVIRDLYAGADAQRLMAHVGTIFAVAPAVAPIIGGWLQSWFGWRAVFVFLVLFACLLFAACWRWLPETLPRAQRQSLHPVDLSRAYVRTMTDPPFLAACAAIALQFVGMFIYVLAAPVFLVQHLGFSEREFAWLFIPLTSGMMFGSWLSGRLAGHLPPAAPVRLGYLLMGAAAAINLGINLAGPALPHWYVAGLPLYTAGMALANPSLSLYALDRAPNRRGLAASCQSFIHTAASALAAGLIVPLLWDSPLYLAFGMLTLLGLGAVATLLYGRFADRPLHSGL